jgi:ABC-type lipoprotein export system ATPase subunit
MKGVADVALYLAPVSPTAGEKRAGELRLSLLGALDNPDSGEIWLDDIAIDRLRGPAAADFRLEKVGFVFQFFYLLPNLSALENVMAPLLPYRRKLSFDLKKRAQELLERVGLGDRQGHSPARLSGGEQQRVAIARALINRPKIVLADEPTGNLDPATGMEVLEVLSELQRVGNQTLIRDSRTINYPANWRKPYSRAILLEFE